MSLFRVIAAALALVMGLGSLPAMAGGNPSGNPEYNTDTPEAYAMVADAVIARPFLIAGTVIGTGLFVVTLPFSALGGGIESAGKALVVEPGKAAFVRCLGCTKSGYQAEQ